MIIDPMYFYKLRVFDLLSQSALIAAIISMLVCAVLSLAGTFEIIDNQKYGPDDKDYINGRKMIKAGIIAGIVMIGCWILHILLPDKETLLEMQIAKLATVENAEWTMDKIKEAVDYIVTKIGELR